MHLNNMLRVHLESLLIALVIMSEEVYATNSELKVCEMLCGFQHICRRETYCYLFVVASEDILYCCYNCIAMFAL